MPRGKRAVASSDFMAPPSLELGAVVVPPDADIIVIDDPHVEVPVAEAVPAPPPTLPLIVDLPCPDCGGHVRWSMPSSDIGSIGFGYCVFSIYAMDSGQFAHSDMNCKYVCRVTRVEGGIDAERLLTGSVPPQPDPVPVPEPAPDPIATARDHLNTYLAIKSGKIRIAQWQHGPRLNLVSITGEVIGSVYATNGAPGMPSTLHGAEFVVRGSKTLPPKDLPYADAKAWVERRAVAEGWTVLP